jgi:hypothetical protein
MPGGDTDCGIRFTPAASRGSEVSSRIYGHVDTHTVLSEMLEELKTALSVMSPRAAGSGSPVCLASRDDVHLCPRMHGLVTALAEAVSATLEVHSPRKASDPGAPQRCRHDNNTWPCKTFAAVAPQLEVISLWITESVTAPAVARKAHCRSRTRRPWSGES